MHDTLRIRTDTKAKRKQIPEKKKSYRESLEHENIPREEKYEHYHN